jgi:lipopolysaccharide assembly protein A
MKALTWILRGLLFGLLFLFALKNHETVALRFYFGLEWNAPLVLLLLIFFAAGMVLGVIACLPRMFRLRRAQTPSAAPEAAASVVAAPSFTASQPGASSAAPKA